MEINEHELELLILDRVIAMLQKLRDSVANTPNGIKDLGIRKKQHYEAGMEDCGK